MAGRDRILVGTTSWGEKTLIACGRFYPREARNAEARLRYYSSVFPITEIDSTYYGLPREEVARSWVDRTPAGFVFDVKAFRLFTQHRTPLSALPADVRDELDPGQKDNVYYPAVPHEIRNELWRRFRAGIAPLQDAGKLGVVLLQFAPWFVYRPSSLELIGACASELRGCQVAVELRNKSWFSRHNRGEILHFERLANLSHVVTDEPQGSAFSVPQIWEATSSDVSVVRLHGREARLWQQRQLSSAAQRFDYLYSDDELGEFVGPVLRLAERSRQVHVLFNNCHEDNAQRNATTLREMLRA